MDLQYPLHHPPDGWRLLERHRAQGRLSKTGGGQARPRQGLYRLPLPGLPGHDGGRPAGRLFRDRAASGDRLRRHPADGDPHPGVPGIPRGGLPPRPRPPEEDRLQPGGPGALGQAMAGERREGKQIPPAGRGSTRREDAAGVDGES